MASLDSQEWGDNGKRYLEPYGLTDANTTTMNFFLSGFCLGPEGIVNVSNGLKENYSLTAIELRRQDIGKEGAVHLGQALRQNRFLKYLGVGRNKLLNEGCIALMEGLRFNQTLEFLDLEWNDIRDEGALAIGEVLKFNNSLQTLVLERNKIKSRGSIAIAEALKVNRKLRNLNFGYNKCMNSGALVFAEMLRDNDSLLTLSFYMNEIRSEGGIAIAQALQQNATLQSLNLQSNKLQEAVRNFAELLVGNNCLREINLQNTAIDEEIAKVLAHGFLSNQSLMSISVSRNPVNSLGFRTIINGLKGKTALQFLDVSDMGTVGLEVVEDVCELIELCGNLQIVCFDDNKIGRQGVTFLASRLERNVAVHSLSLERVEMGREGAMALAVALSKKTYWLSLSVATNNIGDEGVKHILNSLRNMNSVTELDFSENNVTSQCESALYAVLKGNPMLTFIRLKNNPIAKTYPGGVLTRAMAEPFFEGAAAATKTLGSGLGGSSASPAAADAGRPPSSAMTDISAAFRGSTGELSHPSVDSVTEAQSAMQAHLSNFVPSPNFLTSLNRRGVQRGAAPSEVPWSPPTATTVPYPPLVSPMTMMMSPTKSLEQQQQQQSQLLSRTPMFQPSPNYCPPFAGAAPLSFTGDLSPVRRTYNTLVLDRLENNVGNVLVTEHQLRRQFNLLDKRGEGFLRKEEMQAYYSELDNFGVSYSRAQLDAILERYRRFPDGKITFEEFCILMLGVAQR